MFPVVLTSRASGRRTTVVSADPHTITTLTDNGDSTVLATLAAAGAPTDGSFVTVTGTYAGVWQARVLSPTAFTIPATYAADDASRTWAAEGTQSVSYQCRTSGTGADNTALTALTPEAGAAWTAGTGTFKVSSNSIVANSNANGDTAWQDAGYADHTVWADITPRHDGTDSNLSVIALMVRYTDDTHHWLTVPASGEVDLWENTGSGYTLRASPSFAFSSGTAYRVQVTCSGTKISVFVNGALLTEYASATSNQTATKFGIRLTKTGVPPAAGSIDSISVPKCAIAWDTLGAGKKFSVMRPFGLSDGTAAPLVVFFHGAAEDEKGIVAEPLKSDTLAGLVGAGMRVISSEAHGNNWGNQASLDDYAELFAAFAPFNTNKVLFLCGSMGGLASLLGIADAGYGGVAGWYGIFPCCNLADLFAANAGPLSPSIRAAYGIASDGSDYSTLTSGHDPLLLAASTFDGVRMRFTASSGDTVVNKANNADAFAAHVAGHATENTVVRHTGDHGDATAVNALDVMDFFARC